MTKNTHSVSNLIVGAGPAGLAIAGRLRKIGLSFEVLEKTDKIAWSWQNHYDRLCLHTVKELSALPHLPFPEEYPRYVPRKDLVTYYENYAQKFSIQPHFNQEVTAIEKKEQHWIVKTNQEDSFVCDRVIIATGVNRVPFSPTWEGQETYTGELLHSRVYKNPDPFQGKKVLMIGMGNTGAELALDLAEQGVDCTLSVRSAVNIVPRDINGRPTQLTARKLAKLPWGLGDWLGTQIRKRLIGDLSKYGLKSATISPTKQLKETGKTPVIDLGTVAKIKEGKIKVIGDIDRFYEKGIVTKDGEKKEFEVVVLATGYRAQLEDFIPRIEGFLDRYDIPRQAIGEGEQQGLFFVGFDNYKLGGLLGTIFSDSETIAEQIKAQS